MAHLDQVHRVSSGASGRDSDRKQTVVMTHRAMASVVVVVIITQAT
jgi:hypothetical protein